MRRKSKAERKRKQPWTPFVRANAIERRGDPAKIAESLGVTVEAVKAAMEYDADNEIYVNNLYQVSIKPQKDPRFVELSIKRRDKQIIRDWRHLQRIKNELIGRECEAVELFPAESRKVDTANQYWLYGCKDPSFRFALGFQSRLVVDGNDEGTNTRQRPLEDADR